MMTDDEDTNESVKGEFIFFFGYGTCIVYNNRQNIYSNAIMFSSPCEQFLYYFFFVASSFSQIMQPFIALKYPLHILRTPMNLPD